jgi:hypothetical protein
LELVYPINYQVVSLPPLQPMPHLTQFRVAFRQRATMIDIADGGENATRQNINDWSVALV